MLTYLLLIRHFRTVGDRCPTNLIGVKMLLLNKGCLNALKQNLVQTVTILDLLYVLGVIWESFGLNKSTYVTKLAVEMYAQIRYKNKQNFTENMTYT